MGDIAEGLISGEFDFYTGEYIGHGGGYPRSRMGKKFNSPNYKKNPRRGVVSYVQRLYAGRAITPKSIKIIKYFFSETGHEFISEEQMFKTISENFGLFTDWMKKNKEKMYHQFN